MREPGDSPGLLLWRTTLRWQRAVTAALKPLGLTHVQFVLLASAWWLTSRAGEQPTQRRLADYSATDPMMTSQVVRALVARGLLARAPAPDDGRAMQVSVTPAGSDLAARAVVVVEAVDDEFFGRTARHAEVVDVLTALSTDAGPAVS